MRPTSKNLFLFTLLIPGFLLCLLPQAAPAQGGHSIGTNLGFISEGTGEYPFVDAFKFSAGWFAGELHGCFDCAGPLDLDAQGWVRTLDPTVPNGGQVAHAILFNQVSGQYPGGYYTVFYDGQGTLEYEGSAGKDNSLSAPGMDVVKVDSGSPFPMVITLTATTPGNPLRNIRVIMPGGVCSNDPLQYCDNNSACSAGGVCNAFAQNNTYAAQVFHPTFLKNLDRYSVLRLSNWFQVNDSRISDYPEYPELDSARWRTAPVEIMAELANRLEADLWLTLPHLSTDAFLQDIAQRFLARLDPARMLYLEYSNEAWNPTFGQHLEITQRGCQRFAALQAGCDTDQNPGNGIYCEGHPAVPVPACVTAQRRYYSERSVEVWNIFANVFGGTGRLQRIMASQSGNTALHQELLSWQSAHQSTDALATAFYMGYPLGHDPAVASWTLDQLFDNLNNQQIPDAVADFDLDLNFTNQSPNLDFVNYEGGQHLTAELSNPTLFAQMVTLFENANRDPRMEGAYQALLKYWFYSGSPLLLHYMSTHKPDDFGAFGALEYQDQPPTQSPKFRALDGMMDETGQP